MTKKHTYEVRKKISNELGTYTCDYDILGRIVLETDMLGNTKKYEYNELGQVSVDTDR